MSDQEQIAMLREHLNRLDRRVEEMAGRLDNSAAAHADEFAKLEKKCAWLERELRAAGIVLDQHELDIQKIRRGGE